MWKHRKIMLVAVGVGLAATLATATAAYATLPAGTKVTAALKSGTTMTFKGDIDSVPITVSCTSFSASAVTPKKPSDTVTLSAPPKVTGCTDSSGGTDTITTTGKWTLSVKGSKSPYTMTLTIPKAGAKFTSNIISGCTITAAPTKAAGVAGKYDGVNTDTVKNAPIPTKGTGCTSTTATTTATVVLSPSPGKPPF